MSLKFAANLNFLFTENSSKIFEKLKFAHQTGFRAIEIPYPQNEINEVIKAKQETGITVALINIALGDQKYKFGSASIPGGEDLFKKQLSDTIDVAKSLDCKKIHIMAGLMGSGSFDDHLRTYKANLKYAAGCLERENLTGVIEPINKYALPDYFMNSYDIALQVLKEINSKNLKLMLDIFHLQHIRGNVTNSFKEFGDLIGHIQIAQAPHRHEPNVCGELDFKHVFSTIEQSGYSDWIGCEYKPKTSTLDSLAWIKTFGYCL